MMAVVTLSGCVGQPAAPESRTAAPSGSPAPTALDPTCLIGDWMLDLGDFQDRVRNFTEAHGVTWDGPPIIASGAQELTFDATSVAVHSSLRWAAAIDGSSLNLPEESSGSGTWSVDPQSESTIAITGWVP